MPGTIGTAGGGTDAREGVHDGQVNLRPAAHRVRSVRAVDVGVTVLLVVAVYSVGMLGAVNGRLPGLLLPIGALVLAVRWPLLGTTSAAALSVGIAGSATSGNEIGYAPRR